MCVFRKAKINSLFPDLYSPPTLALSRQGSPKLSNLSDLIIFLAFLHAQLTEEIQVELLYLGFG